MQIMYRMLLFIDGCYSIPNMTIRGHMCKTNLQPVSAMRGAGAPQAEFFAEQIIREVAGYLQMTPLQVL